jgi:hypothetical protein
MATQLPINIDMKISCLHGQQGGDPTKNLALIKNLSFQCLKSLDETVMFKYDQTINTKILNGSMYLGKGSNTTVISVTQQKGLVHLNGQSFVIRITEPTTQFNNLKYTSDKQLLGHHIPDAYYYGKLHCLENKVLNYVVVKKYNVFDSQTISNMRIHEKRNILYDLINCLTIIQDNNYVLWDLKIDNIGFDNNFKCILIDYSDDTIMKIDNKFYLASNTYYPSYFYIAYISFIGKYDESTRAKNATVKKISANGLADVILNLFYNIKKNDAITHASIGNLHFGGTYNDIFNTKSFNFDIYNEASDNEKDWWHNSFINLINGYKIKEYISLLSHTSQSEYNFDNILNNILFDYNTYSGLLSPEYSKIPKYSKIQSVLTEYEKNYDMDISYGGGFQKKYEKYKIKNKKLLKNIN